MSGLLDVARSRKARAVPASGAARRTRLQYGFCPLTLLGLGNACMGWPPDAEWRESTGSMARPARNASRLFAWVLAAACAAPGAASAPPPPPPPPPAGAPQAFVDAHNR